nr:cyclin-D-binding Myb-like transcription factor 1 [Ipomoea trifida]
MAVEDEVVGALTKSEKSRKSKKRKERNNDILSANPVYIVKDVGVEGDKSILGETLTKMKSDSEGVERMKKKKKDAGDNKRRALMEDTNGITASGVGNDDINQKQVKDSSKDPKRKNSKKKVRFSNELKVFPKSNVPESGKGQNEVVELIRGKRFSKIEDERVKEAVFKYIEVYNLGNEGLDMVLNCRSHPEVKNCWKEIGAAIPYRPYPAVNRRAHILFRRSENQKWSEEEKALILEHVKLNGNVFKSLADRLGRHTFHVRETWRRICLPNLKKGRWSQDEYQNLFDLVNTDLQLRIFEEKRSMHGMLRDNICWTAISNKLSTRSSPQCCLKWYYNLTSPMVAEGTWSDSDDYRLIGALYTLDATCIENVEWDNLLEHRAGELCLKRWKQMVIHIGNHWSKPFSEQVEVLAKRYCPSLIEVREAWDNKPLVP